MTTCGACNQEVEGDFAFCPYCGSPLAPPSPTEEQRKRVSILFCDVTGSTALGEAIDPETLRAVLARYFDRMQGIISSHGGTVEKFIGDAVMAVFGVPVLHEDDALRALRAAAQMQATVPELGLQVRIGVNSGEVVTGTRERLATGDAVNVAARLQGAAQPGEVLLGEETRQLAEAAIETEPVDPLVLKGKRERVPAYRLLRVLGTGERSGRLTPMIGRERERRRVQDAYDQALHDRSCQLFTVLGSAGVGKSRLARAFLEGVEGARVVRGRCLSYGEGITYWPVLEVLGQLETLPTDPYAASALQSVLGTSSVVASAEEIAWAFRTLLEEQAREQPLVVVFDDIQWGEETFLALIEHLADLSREAPLFLLCLARPELLERRPGWGGGTWNATTILLEPLDARETDLLLEALGGVEAGLGERIREAAEGNPLFVEEMLALIAASGGREVTVPPTIQALLAARLDQLEPEERRVLACGSVEGRTFHRSAVQVLAPDATNIGGKLTGLVRKELVRPARGGVLGDEAYRFRHLLIRDAAYDALPKVVRAQLHERFAGWLQERGWELVELDEILGYHLEQAARYQQELGTPVGGLAERAGERLGAAGRRALWRGDTGAARGLLERALTLLRPIRLAVDLELDLADTQPTEEGAALLAEGVAERAAAAGNRPGEAVSRVVAAFHRLESGLAGSVDELEALVQEAIPLLEETGDDAGLVRVWNAFGFGVANLHGRFDDWARAAEQAIGHARQIGQPGSFYLSAALVFGPRPADEALQILDPLLDDDPDPAPRVSGAWLLAMLGRFEEAWAIAREASERFRELGHEEMGESALFRIAALAGDHEAAARYGLPLCNWLEKHGRVAVLSTHAPMLGRSLSMLGRYDEAEPLAQMGWELGDEQDVATQTVWRQVLALVCSARGQHDEAEQLAREAVAIAEGTDGLNMQGDTFCDLAEVLERAGRSQDAKATLEEALERYQRKRNLAMVAQVKKRLGAGELPVRANES